MKVAIENVSSENVTVSATSFNVKIEKVDLVGREVPTQTVSVRFFEHPRHFQRDALTTLRPGEEVSLGVSSAALGPGDVVLSEVLIGEQNEHFFTHYGLVKPGEYEVQVAYEFEGDGEPFPNVFRGRVRSNTISFAISGP